MKPYVFLLSILAFCSSCRTIRVTDVQPGPTTVNPPLPPLEPAIDIESFLWSYTEGVGATEGDVNGAGVPIGPIFLGSTDFSSTTVQSRDKRIRDVATIWTREVSQRISAPGRPIGAVVLSVPFKETRPVAMGYLIPSMLSVGILNLFDMPFFKYRTELELAATVYDCNDEPIGNYLGYGTAKAKMSLYTGYYGTGSDTDINSNLTRKSNIDAAKEAMAVLKRRMQRDHSRLTAELESCVVKE